VIVLIAIVASALVFMKRGKRSTAQETVLKKEVAKEEPRPESRPELKPPTDRTLPPKPEVQIPKPEGVALRDSISTGYSELDAVLAGGLPVGYAILIVSLPCDERDLLFQRIIESSISMGSQIFFLSRDLIRTQDYANKYQKDFHVFSPQAEKLTPSGGKIFKIHGLQNLSDLNISFTKAVEELPKAVSSKLIIVDLLSDVLLEHKALTTRKWLDGFIGKRKAEGFTIIGVLNPLISMQQDVQTLMDLFDGIIEIYERELKERSRRFLVVKKMYGRRYSDTEVMLDKDKLY
jgi:KaiC/GvpD/RAD55 family RecA-like ATPase